MILLFLDDLAVRHDTVEELMSKAGHIVLHAFNPYEAMDLLSTYPKQICILMLDHDLQYYIQSENGKKIEKTGHEVITYMAEHLPKDKYPPIAIAHTHNANGKFMVEDLQKLGVYAQHRPFCREMIIALCREFELQ